MRTSIILLGAAAGLASCSPSSEHSVSGNAEANAASPPAQKAAYCFFKDSDTKEWKAKAGKDGNVVVSGKAFAEDARYKALLAPAVIHGAGAEIAPTITTNDTGFAAPGNWWSVSETIPGSEAVTTVTVKCGEETLATLSVPRKK